MVEKRVKPRKKKKEWQICGKAVQKLSNHGEEKPFKGIKIRTRRKVEHVENGRI